MTEWMDSDDRKIYAQMAKEEELFRLECSIGMFNTLVSLGNITPEMAKCQVNSIMKNFSNLAKELSDGLEESDDSE